MTDIDDILLAVADPEASARFYAGLLGRRPLMAGPDRALFMMRSGRALGLMRRANAEAGEGRELEFPLEDPAAVEQAHIDCWDRGARILIPPMEMEAGRGFVARDPDGNRLRVFAPA